jgi:hypothetical protein
VIPPIRRRAGRNDKKEMFMTLIENSVPLAELAKVMRTTTDKLEAEAVALSMYVGEDWAGRPAVSARDAYGLRSGAARRAADDASRWEQHRRDVDAWELAREEVVTAAGQAAYDKAVRQGDGSPKAYEASQEASVAAGRAYESNNPPPSVDGQSMATRRFQQESGVFRRVAERIKESVA